MAIARALCPDTPTVPARNADALAGQVRSHGFTLIGPTAIRALLGADRTSADAAAFVASWDDLPLDEYMADGGRYRRRRHAVYTVDPAGNLTREAHQPHYQSRRDNPLNGGIARWFAPIDAGVGAGPTLQGAIGVLIAVANRVRPSSSTWRAEVHQFRIEARPGIAGRPTPEGAHRDGVDFVLVMLVGRRNARHGVTTVSNDVGLPLLEFQLARRFEAIILDDVRVRHGVSPIEPADLAEPASRDALVVTVTAQGHRG